eukprot:2197218-Alexandrium_andersonii.AAC.1
MHFSENGPALALPAWAIPGEQPGSLPEPPSKATNPHHLERSRDPANDVETRSDRPGLANWPSAPPLEGPGHGPRARRCSKGPLLCQPRPQSKRLLEVLGPPDVAHALLELTVLVLDLLGD